MRIDEDAATLAGAGPPIQIRKYYAYGVSHQLFLTSREVWVWPENRIFDGSFAERLFFYGTRLPDVVDLKSLSVRTAKGRTILSGRLVFPPPDSSSFPPGATFELTASAVPGHPPERMVVWVRGKLREDMIASAVKHYGGVAYPSRIVVRRYTGGTQRHRWVIEPVSIVTGSGVSPDAFIPVLPDTFRVADYRLAPGREAQPHTYSLGRGESFPTLDELRRRPRR